MKLLLPLLAFAVAAGPACAASANGRPPITPGYWESTNRLISPISQTSVEKRCITAADVHKFMAGPSNRHYACTYPTRVIAGGKIRLKGACVDKKGRTITVEGQGSYTPESFAIEADIAMDFLGLPIAGRASTEAHRIGDSCPSAETAAVTGATAAPAPPSMETPSAEPPTAPTTTDPPPLADPPAQ